MPDAYLIQCFNCLSEFDAVEAIWCSCNPQRPTKVCPFCLGCFCAAGEPFKEGFWRDAPTGLRAEIDTLSQSRMLLGEMLVRSGVITTTQLLDALNRQKVDGRRIGEILVDSGALPADRLERFLQSQHTVTSIDVTRARVDAMMIRRLGVDQCIAEKILPLEAEAFRDRHIMTLAMGDPSNTGAVERVMQATGYQVIPGVASGDAIVSVIRSIFPPGASGIAEPAAPAAIGSSTGAWAAVMARAVERRASHVEIRWHEGSFRLFYRMDGTLFLDRAGGGVDPVEALSELKTMAGPETGTGASPRAARARAKVDGVEYQIIVRVRQGRESEEVTAKILDPIAFPPRLDELALPAEAVERLRMAIDKEAGLVAVSAPPLSGASSTFYALVMELAAQGRPLALVESPRAVSLTDVAQEEFFPEVAGSLTDALARAAASRATAVAITSATGFSWPPAAVDLAARSLVICRVESLSLPDALLRLVAGGYPAADLGLRPTLVLHQRLVRRICQACRTESSTAEEIAGILRLEPGEARKIVLWRGRGCEECGPTPGYRGRMPLAQTLRTNPAVARAVERGSSDELLKACRTAGMTSLRKEALAALAGGLTTPEEITRKPLSQAAT